MPGYGTTSRNYCQNNTKTISCGSVDLIVDEPINTLVIDATQGSVCEIIIRAQVNNILVKGTSRSYVSMVFQPQSVDCCGNPVQAGLCNVDAIAQGCNTGISSATKGILPSPALLSEVCYQGYVKGKSFVGR